jgi:ABC-type nitrate/sulfonate/bicarbonate transport system permease component
LGASGRDIPHRPIVAELAARGWWGTGLAFRIVEAGDRLDIPRMFAAWTLISLSGIAIFYIIGPDPSRAAALAGKRRRSLRFNRVGS